MFPAKFDYYRAASVDEALDLLGRHADARLLAGGHSLLPMMKMRLAEPAALIDIGRIAELSGIRRDGDTFRIGALTTHAELADSPELAAGCPLLAEAAATIADPQVRNKGTLGGNIAHADPGSDLPAALVALAASVELRGPGGPRSVVAADFFVDLLTTAVGEDEVLLGVDVPALASAAGACYLKMEHPASGYAVCGAAAVAERGADGTVAAVRLAFNGVTATPLDAAAVCDALVGTAGDGAALASALEEHLEIEDPLEDGFVSGPYRQALARRFGERALAAALARAGG